MHQFYLLTSLIPSFPFFQYWNLFYLHYKLLVVLQINLLSRQRLSKHFKNHFYVCSVLQKSYLTNSYYHSNSTKLIMFEDSFDFKGRFACQIFTQKRSLIDRHKKCHCFYCERFERFFFFSLCWYYDHPGWNQTLLGL